MNNIFLRYLCVGAVAALAPAVMAANANHLVLSEIGVYPSIQTPVSAEFVEIFNPTNQPIALDNYYLTDSNKYIEIPTAPGNMVDTNTTDNILRFPAGSVLQPGQVAVVTGGAQVLLDIFYGGSKTQYDTDTGGALLFEVENTSVETPEMIALNNDAEKPLNFGLTNAGTTNGEFVILFYWDGASFNVRDVDMAAWGAPASGQNRFSPKGGNGYALDAGNHDSMSITTSSNDDVLIRVSTDELSEIATGGNGITGHDETTEAPASWTVNTGRDANMTPGVTDLLINSEPVPPLITNLARDKKYPAITDTVTLSATVTDPGDTLTVTFAVDNGDGAGFVDHVATNVGDIYSVTLPAVSEPTLIKYYITATDAGSATITYPVLGENGALEFWHGEPFAGDTILINEIQFDIIGTDNTEWIELYNRNSEEVSLAGYRIADATGEYLRFPDDALIAGHGFVLVTYNEPNMRDDYPGIPSGVPVYTYPFSQNNPGDTLTITSPNEYNFDASLATPIDIVEYSKTAPWPEVNPNVTGQSFELKSPNLDNNDGANWAPHPEVMVGEDLVNSGTPGEVNSMTSSVSGWSVY